MSGINVIFVIGNDILERLTSLLKPERMSFVLGFIEDDYFGKHFYTIEDLDDYCENVLQYFEISKDLKLEILNNGSDLNPLDEECMLFYVNPEYVHVIARSLERLTTTQVKWNYLNMKNLFPDTEIDYEQFNFYIDTFLTLSKEAIQRNGTLLLSMEPYHRPLRKQ